MLVIICPDVDVVVDVGEGRVAELSGSRTLDFHARLVCIEQRVDVAILQVDKTSLLAEILNHDPGDGFENRDRRVPVYTDLKGLMPVDDQREPGREIDLHLTGNKERFMWSFNGKKYSEAKTPIAFRYGERLRFTFVNDTMMEQAGTLVASRFHRDGWLHYECGNANDRCRSEGVRRIPGRKTAGLGRHSVRAFWEYAAFVANSLIFLLIGLRVGQQSFRVVLGTAIIAIALVMEVRAIAVYPMSAVFRRTRMRMGKRHQHILFWGGLRGALALALALGLPPQMPRREEIITVAFAVVAFSILVQGLTITPLLRRMGELSEQTR